MKVLIFAPRNPFSATDGFALYVHNVFGALARVHEIGLALRFPEECPLPLPDAPVLRTFQSPGSGGFRMPRWRYLFPKPYTFGSSQVSREWARAVVGQYEPDIVLLGAECMGPLAEALKGLCPLVYLPLDSSARNLFEVGKAHHGWRMLWLWSHALRWVIYERKLAGLVDATVLVSKRDARWLASERTMDSLHVLSNGVDAAVFRKREEICQEYDVAISGNFRYAPNADGLREGEAIVKRVRTLGGRAVRVCVCGRIEPAARAQLPADWTVHENVPDIGAAIQAAKVFLSPVRFGSGIRNNVLQAMACEMPIVTYPVNVEAIEGRDGSEFLVAGTRDKMAENILGLLGSASWREDLGRNARRYVLAHHDWGTVGSRFEKLLESCHRKWHEASIGRQEIKK